MWIKPGLARHERPAQPAVSRHGEHGPALPASTTLPQRRRLSTQVRARQASRRGTASTRYGHAGVTVEERPLSGCR